MFIQRPDDPRTPDGAGGPAPAAIDRLAEITRLDVDIARLQGQQMVHMAAHVADVQAAATAAAAAATDPDERFYDANLPVKSAYAEINLVLNISGRNADTRIGQARELAARLPRVLAAVCAGELTQHRAVIILEQTCGLDDEELAEAETKVLAAAPAPRKPPAISAPSTNAAPMPSTT
jgi:hypothetical protein